MAEQGINDFEHLVRSLYPTIEQAFKASSLAGPAKLTGSGACLFIAFDNKQDARDGLQLLTESEPNLRTFIAQGMNISTVHKQLALQ